MGMTVVGLFETVAEAEASRQELKQNGFAAHEIDLREPVGAHQRGGDMSELMEELREDGVPDEDARLYVAGVQQGDALEFLRTTNEKSQIALDIMNRHGALDIHHAHEVRTRTTTTTTTPGAVVGTAVAAATMSTAPVVAAPVTQTINTAGETVLPVVEEEIALGKREINRGGVRVYTRVTETPVEESINLREEHVTIERHAVNRPVDAATMSNLREGVIEVTETTEVPVVAKEARIVEEVVVGKEATERVETVHDTVRRTDVEVEQIAGTTTTTGTTFDTATTTDRKI